MNIVLVEFNCTIDQEIKNTINPSHFITSKGELFSQLKFIGLEIDELYFLGKLHIDWVLFASNNNIRWDDFLKITPYVDIDSNTIFKTKQRTETELGCENFYCRPNVMSVLASIYKLNKSCEFMLNVYEKSTDKNLALLTYVADRAGLNFCTLP